MGNSLWLCRFLRTFVARRYTAAWPLGGPPSGQAAVYRLATKVRKNLHNHKLFPTFTLPRAVALKR